MIDEITFRKLGGDCHDETATKQEDKSSLELWYDNIRDIPLTKFNDADLCRACRQELYIDHTVPEAVSRLKKDPFTEGDNYEGELLAALRSIPSSYWERNCALADSVLGIADIVTSQTDDDYLKRQIKIVASRINS